MISKGDRQASRQGHYESEDSAKQGDHEGRVSPTDATPRRRKVDLTPSGRQHVASGIEGPGLARSGMSAPPQRTLQKHRPLLSPIDRERLQQQSRLNIICLPSFHNRFNDVWRQQGEAKHPADVGRIDLLAAASSAADP